MAGKSGSIGANHPFDWSKDAQKYIENEIQNRSAIIKNAIPAIQQLKKVSGNPSAIDSIGKGNYQAIMQQTSQWFGSQGQNQDSKLFDCEYLLKTPDELLTEEEKNQKRFCQIVEDHEEVDANTATSNVISNSVISNTGSNVAQSGLSLTLELMANNISLKANTLNANLTGNTVIAVLSVTGNTAFGNGVVIGSPTGGNKGSGTLNLAGDIYKNNTAYTNPDYVFEHYFDGKIEEFKKNPGASTYTGLMELERLENYLRAFHRLPGVSDEGWGIFTRTDFLLEKVEELYLYSIELNKRINELEKDLESAKSAS